MIYSPIKPEVSARVQRILADDESNSYIEWSISISELDHIVASDTMYYKIYKDDNTEPFKFDNITIDHNLMTIRINFNKEQYFKN